MRIAGVVGLDLLFAATGLAVLFARGFVRSRSDAVRLGGLAVVAGWALAGVATSYLMLAGGSGSAIEVTLLALALALVAAAAGWRRLVPPLAVDARESGRPSSLDRTFSIGGLVLLVLSLLAMLRSVVYAQPAQWDAWAFWVPKAESIVYTHGIHTGPGSIESFANPDYPPFVPSVDATVFRFAGHVEPGLLPAQHWFIVACMFAALVGLLWRRVAPSVLFPSLAAMSLLPTVQHDVGSLLGDESLLVAVALVAVSATLWTITGRAQYLALYALSGAAMALIKNEGFTDVIAMGVLLVLVSVWKRRPHPALSLVVVPPLAMVPWKLWSSAHHVPPDPYYKFSNLLHPGFLTARGERLWYTLHHLPAYYTSFDRWLVVVPAAVILLFLLARRQPRLTVFVAGTVAIAFAGNVVVYWISPAPVGWYISTSAERTSTAPLVFLAALLPLLISEVAAGTARATAAGQPLTTEPEPA